VWIRTQQPLAPQQDQRAGTVGDFSLAGHALCLFRVHESYLRWLILLPVGTFCISRVRTAISGSSGIVPLLGKTLDPLSTTRDDCSGKDLLGKGEGRDLTSILSLSESAS